VLGFLLCFVISVLEWFLVAKRTEAITKRSRLVGLITVVEVAFGLGAGFLIFVPQNLFAAVGCALGAGLGAELARRKK